MISFLLPTRNRPERIRRCIKTCVDGSNNPHDIEFVLYVDDDDNTTNPDTIDFGVSKSVIIRGPRIDGSSRAQQYLVDKSSGDILCYWADDVYILTKGWDDLVKSKFVGDKIWLVYPTNVQSKIKRPGKRRIRRHRSHDFAIHGFVSRKSIEVVGYLWPEFSSYYADKFLWERYGEIGRLIKLDEFESSHEHPLHTFPTDKTYEDNLLNSERTIRDAHLYYSLVNNKGWVKKMKRYIASVDGEMG